ncbi:MAG TPA: PQQ-binding-like beta-propeller repeat protein [Gemmataceae bacterium]|nr:PQQ-binding-like beta-propeller repeat protein [Gemmataceae bacterium]
MILLRSLRGVRYLVVVWLILGNAALSSFGEPPVWPQWRGPTRDSHITGPEWPSTLKGDALQRLWRVGLGPGYSGPVVAADRIFVVETKDKEREIVRALDRKNGKELWRAEWEASITVPAYARGNGEWVKATPAYDGDALYVPGMRDVLVCLDASTGKERWRIDFVQRYKTPIPPYGFVCSPLVDGDAVYVQAAAALVKLDRKTGRVRWRVLEYKSSPNGTAVSSPVMATLAGKRQLVVQHPKQLVGVDPDSGEVLWSETVPAFRSINIITPTIYKDSVLTSAFGGRTFLVTIAKEGDHFTATAAWTNKAQGYMSSPVIVGGHAYMHLRNQRVTCLDLKTGEEAWTTEKTFGKYWSMVVTKDRVLALDQSGTLYLFRATPEQFDLIDEREISSDETWGHLAVCGDELYVRELNAIAVYRWRSRR